VISDNQAQGFKLLFIVPAYNEERNIGRVITEIAEHAGGAEILIIDDGSSDATASVARSAGASVIQLPHNLGIGGAVQTGYKFARQGEHDYVVRLDGDGQHDASFVERLIQPLRVGMADMVIGSRYLGLDGFRAQGLRAIGVKLFSVLVSLAVHRRFTDTTSGFQAANRDAVIFLADHLPTDYPEIEGLLLLCRAGYRVLEVPVTMRPRTNGRSSITKAKSFYYVIKIMLAILVEMLRRPLPKGGVG
jgi:glycosyltransferase involved in cell wall biosynthesis